MQNVHCLQVILMLTPKPGTGKMSRTTCPCSPLTPSARSVTSLWSSLLSLFIKFHYRQGCGQPAQLPEDQQERERDGGGDSPPTLQGEEPGQIHGQYRQYSYSSCVVCTLRARLLANQTALKRQNLQVVTKQLNPVELWICFIVLTQDGVSKSIRFRHYCGWHISYNMINLNIYFVFKVLLCIICTGHYVGSWVHFLKQSTISSAIICSWKNYYQ